MRRAVLLVAIAFLAACMGGNAAFAAAPEVDLTHLPPVPRWASRVSKAHAAKDSASRRDLLVALTRDALQGTGYEVHVAGTQSLLEPSPIDYRPVPAINFDIDLNYKSSRKFTATTRTRSLDDNAGYYFHEQRVAYVVIGPGALSPDSPDTLRMYIDHELHHALHHVGDNRPFADRELETWVTGFRRWFLRIRERRGIWEPMLRYYDDAQPVEQRKALDALIDYYRHPPQEHVRPEEVKKARAQFMTWLKRGAYARQTDSRKLLIALRAAGL